MSDDPTYVVTCLGMTLTAKDGSEKELATGERIKRSVLLTYMRVMYIDALIKNGDLAIQEAT